MTDNRPIGERAFGAPAAPRRPTVAIVGGGFSGAVLAHQLVRRAPGGFRVVVVEPRHRLGAGVAYSTSDPAHRINVPSSRMSFVPSDPCHFDRWLKADGALAADPQAVTPDGRAFPRRSVFGRYAAETIDPHLMSGEIEHVVAAATSIRRKPDGYRIALDDGGAIEADHVAFAATHPSPVPPAALAPLAGDPRLVVDTQAEGALDAIAPDARVLIVGTGLTMADIVASLTARGHRGSIVAVSRRGLLSRGHSLVPGEFGNFAVAPSRTAREVVRGIRRAVAGAAAVGRPWQHALDGVRNQGQAIWAALPEAERRTIVRRLRTFWDVHRFRVAPQVEETISRLRAGGRLTVLAGRPVGANADRDVVTVELRLRDGRLETIACDAVAVATGPAHRKLHETSGLVADLIADGVIRPDAVGLGFDTDRRSRAIGSDGAPSPSFWICGPLARGAFGELMGLPEVARHAELVAGEIARLASAPAEREPRRWVA